MANVRCPKCGKNNPDLLEVCQYCQTPLKPDSVLHIGQTPTKKNTGELESVLPAWLRDVRQQARDSAEEEPTQMPAQSKVEKEEEPPDLLAGLVSQSGAADDEEIPDWLASLNPPAAPKPAAPPAEKPPSTPAPEFDFFAQFNRSEPAPVSKPPHEEPVSPFESPANQPSGSAEDELSKWFAQASTQPEEIVEIDPETGRSGEAAWVNPFDSSAPPREEPAAKEEEDLSWLHNLEATARETGELQSPKPASDWMANFETPSTPPGSSPEDLSWLDTLGGIEEKPATQSPGQPLTQGEDLSWLDKLGGTSESQPFDASPAKPEPTSTPAFSSEDLSWLNNLGGESEPQPFEAASAQPASTPSFDSKEDLSWLNNLGGTSEPAQSREAAPQGPSASQEDLDWLNNLGKESEPQPFDAVPAQPASTPPFDAKEDLSWLNDLGGESEPQPFDAAPVQPAAASPFDSKEDLSWLNNLGGTPEPAQPVEAAPQSPSASQEDLNWLNNLGKESESQPFDASPVQPVSAPPFESKEDLDWLNNLGGQTEPQFTPPFVESTSPDAPQATPVRKEEVEAPDWLKSAMEVPSMPPPGDVSLNWFTEKEPPAEPREPAPATPQPSPFSDIFATPGEPSPGANQDVDSLFSVEMPDWLSGTEPAAGETAAPPSELPPALGEESLAPVDLPSWVQAMRPVEAVISETGTGAENEPEETQGPLAGLRGVIPGMAVGASKRPKAISLKLQASDEQQAGAALLEQILSSETSPRSLITSSFVASQQVLRWIVSALFLLGLGAVIFLRSQMIPVSADLSDGMTNLTSAVMNVPANANVLVIVDYEPSLAGEMEATGGPLLDYMVLLGHPRMSFLSTSPNGSALVERLMTNTKINQPVAQGGFEYQAGVQYCNLGFLPGGASGALGFIKSPGLIKPSTCEGFTAGSFSEYQAVILMTDHAESGRVWVEQLYAQKQVDPAVVGQPLFVVASAQAGPLLQPYEASQQISGMISGIADAARYEYKNAVPPGLARSYWDAFGIGLMMAVALIVIGSLWGLFTGIRARQAEAEQG